MRSKIKIEPLTLKHAEVIYALTDSNREYLGKWLPWVEYVTDCSGSIDFINSVNVENAPPNFAVRYQEEVCGVIGFHQVDRNNRLGSIGYWLAEDYIGKGIITTALKHVLSFGFQDLNLHKIEIRCAEKNIKSRAVPQRLGFVCEATLRDCEWLNNQYVNHAVYTLLKTEFS